jgi:large subunit ribosomal protein L23
MSSILQMIRKPLVTEKSEGMKDENVYTFAVAKAANKGQIAAAVVEAFKVEVTAVRTLVVRGKNRRRGGISGRTATWKKAYVTIADGQEIEALDVKEDFSEEVATEAEA